MGGVYQARLAISRETETHWANGATKLDRPGIEDDVLYSVPGWRLRQLKDTEAAFAVRRVNGERDG